MVLAPAEIHPADVLLYRGDSIISRLIRFFDRAEVNHAGLYLGDAHVGEALGQGVVQTDLDKSLAGSQRVLVRRLTTPVESMAPVLARADQFLEEGHKYAFEQILLLALLCLSRRVKVSPTLSVLVRKILDEAATWLLKTAGDEGPRQPMICSEYVYRCYDEALPATDDVYTLSIDLATPRALVPMAPLPAGRGVEEGSILSMALLPSVRGARRIRRAPVAERLDDLGRRYLDERLGTGVAMRLAPLNVAELAPSIEAFADAWHRATGAVLKSHPLSARAQLAETPMQTLTRAAADFVTPGDLLKSSSLFEVGDAKER